LEFETGVRSVREVEHGAERGKEGNAPYLMLDGTLVIPFDSPPRFHWWKGGQSIAQTRAEVLPSPSRRGTTTNPNHFVEQVEESEE
jgi:hypothetical protein